MKKNCKKKRRRFPPSLPSTQNLTLCHTCPRNKPPPPHSRARPAGLSPALQDEVFLRVKEINATGVTVVMVEQNARRCLQIVDRGYVLDQGRNAYEGTGADLANDPKVIELYLGSLSQA